MARSFRIHKKDGTKVAEGESPLSITGVSPNTSVASGDYYAIAVENGYDSEPVNIPSFTTLPILATSVTLNKTTLTLDGGSSETLTATVLPANTTNKTVTWKSSNTAVATVSTSGVVSAVKGTTTGTANITATTTNGNVATCSLTVTQYEVTVNGVAATAAYAPKDISQADYLAITKKDNNTLYRVQPIDSGSGRVHFLGSQIVDLTKDKDGNVVYSRNLLENTSSNLTKVTFSSFGDISTRVIKALPYKQITEGSTILYNSYVDNSDVSNIDIGRSTLIFYNASDGNIGDMIPVTVAVGGTKEGHISKVVPQNTVKIEISPASKNTGTNTATIGFKNTKVSLGSVYDGYTVAPEDIASSANSGGGTFG